MVRRTGVLVLLALVGCPGPGKETGADDTATSPRDDTGAPGDDTGKTSDDTGKVADDTATSPGDDTGKSGDDTGKSGDDTGKSGDDTGKSGDDTGKSADDTAISGDDTAVSGDDTAVSGDDTAVSGDDTGGSRDDTAVSGDDTAVSGDDTAVSGDDTATSTGDDTGTSTGDDTGTSPGDDTGTSTGDDTGAPDTGAPDTGTSPADDTGVPTDTNDSTIPTDTDTGVVVTPPDTSPPPDTGDTPPPDTGPADTGKGDPPDTGTPVVDTGAPVDTADSADTGDTADTGGGTVTRFVAIGDAGTGDVSQFDVATAVEAICATNGCDFAVYLGDNFYPTGVADTSDTQWIDKFELPYSALTFVFHAVLGNHDYGGGGSGYDTARAQAQVDYTTVSTKWSMPDRYYVETVDDVSFLALDTTAIFMNHGSAQEAWVSSAIASMTGNWKFALGHHPYISNGPHGNAGDYDGNPGEGENVRDFFDAYVCGQVDVYLCGHDHSLQWLEPSCGTQFMISGGGSTASFLPGTNATYFEAATTGFVWFELDGNTMTAVYYDGYGAELYRGTYTK